MSDIDLGTLIRAVELHVSENHRDGSACSIYCATDIEARYDDPRSMELTENEEAAEAATWD